MPIMKGRDSKGPYVKWSESGFKYRHTDGDKPSEDAATKKAKRQAEAIYASGYKGK